MKYSKNENNVDIKKEQKQKKTKNKTKIILIFTIVIGILVTIIIINNTNNNFIFDALPFNQSVISKKELTNILKNDDSGIGVYLQENTVKMGSVIDINYNNFDKLLSYRCNYINNNITFNQGGAILYNQSDKSSKIILVSTDLSSIIYYLNYNRENTKLESVMKEIMNYIVEYGYDEQIGFNNADPYVELGKKNRSISRSKIM